MMIKSTAMGSVTSMFIFETAKKGAVILKTSFLLLRIENNIPSASYEAVLAIIIWFIITIICICHKIRDLCDFCLKRASMRKPAGRKGRRSPKRHLLRSPQAQR
jgi:hypothetical protein